MENNILVIGAAGHVCLEVVKLLNERNMYVRIAARNPDRAKALNLSNVEVFHFDYCDPNTFDPVFHGIQSVLFVSPPAHYKLQNCIANVVQHAVDEGVINFVNISAMGIHDDKNPFRIIESHIENSGMSYTFLRPNLYMQYFNTFFRQAIVEDSAIQIPVAKARTSYVDMRDVAEAAAKLLISCEHENKTYLLTGNDSLNLYQVANIFTEKLKRDISYFEIDEEDYRLLLRAEGWAEASIDASIEICRNMRKGWNAIITYGIRALLNREPTSFQDYVIDYAYSWKEIITEDPVY
jgi:uncharacterized protein YbjT (DUF2867 family)